MSGYGSRTGVLVLVLVALPMGLGAQEHGEEAAESAEHQGESHGESHEESGHGEDEHGFHKNSIEVFLGSTQAEKHGGERDDPRFTLGFDYERRLSQVFGIGAVLDLVLEGHREGILAATGVAHWGQAKFILAPGVERVRDGGDTAGVVRFGLMYSFPAGYVHLEPSLFYDVTEEGGTWVLGLSIGHSW